MAELDSAVDLNNKRRPDPVDAHVSVRLRTRRLSLGLSQEELGGQLGLTFQQIQKYEKAANRISASRLYRLARILGCSPGYFFEGLEEQEAAGGARDDDTLAAFMRSREGVELCIAFTRIEGAEQRKAILALVRSLGRRGASSCETSED